MLDIEIVKTLAPVPLANLASQADLWQVVREIEKTGKVELSGLSDRSKKTAMASYIIQNKKVLFEKDTEDSSEVSTSTEDSSEDSSIKKASPEPTAQDLINNKGNIVTSAFTADAKRTGEKINKQPKVTIVVPLEEGEPENSVQNVSINGYKWSIKKGVMVSVPEQVARMIMKRLKVEMQGSALAQSFSIQNKNELK